MVPLSEHISKFLETRVQEEGICLALTVVDETLELSRHLGAYILVTTVAISYHTRGGSKSESTKVDGGAICQVNAGVYQTEVTLTSPPVEAW